VRPLGTLKIGDGVFRAVVVVESTTILHFDEFHWLFSFLVDGFSGLSFIVRLIAIFLNVVDRIFISPRAKAP